MSEQDLVTEMSLEEALKHLMKFAESKGYKENYTCSEGRWQPRIQAFELEMIKPYGLYFVYSDGSVNDNYGTFD